MEITNVLDESLVLLNLSGGDKSEVLTNLVKPVSHKGVVGNRDEVLDLLLERERLKTTGIGSGIAIPHCKVKGVERIHLVIGISREGIAYQSLDENPAHLFFLVVALADTCSDHLKICSRIVRLVREQSVRDDLLALGSEEAVTDYIRDREIALG